MVAQDLRSAFAALEGAGDAVVVKAPIDWRYEAAAVLWELMRGPAVRMDAVVGYDVPIVGNMLNSPGKLATALGVPADRLQEHVLASMDQLIPAEMVSAAPCQEIVDNRDLDVLRRFPVPEISEADGGRYVSAGMIICRDPATGRQNLAICRVRASSDGRLGCYLAPTHSAQFLAAYRRLGRRMDVAIVVGCHPAVLVASQMLVPVDEMQIAGGLLGEPLRVAAATTVDLVVPAEAEIVLEGWIDPEETAEEGPFGEFPGTYAPARDNPVINLTAITTRQKPWFQMIVGGRHPEHLVTGAIAREAGLLRTLRAVVPGTRRVVLTAGGSRRFHAVVAIDQRVPGEAKLVATAALASQDLIKHVVVVDDDIDPSDPEDVEWAIATRMRAHEDLVVIPGMKSNSVDPMSIERTITKIAVDATLPASTSPEIRRLRVGVPAHVAESVRERWRTILPDSGRASQPSK